ncbi:MAG: tetratricopeptide repeat protein [Chloroflexi bacterium]|nr:tetratricopeptide repeat protein [Chloroflexota bacterium]MCI0574702.1 tetratricopeptide repeat protein [Chloroflexota bacterium]MCI0647405.1 tetratricopeptide repeat protein [Chloroflexota bacterium]MCI0728884.1 tetratricopeptide repeat protein [Chloroflexota bacterium]
MSHSSVSGVFGSLNIPHEALDAYRAGKAATNEQKYSEAAELYSQALSFDELPPIFRARTLEQRGVCTWLVGQYELAEQDFRRALEISDDKGLSARLRARLGDVADSQGQYEPAYDYYTEALRMGMACGDLIAIGRAHRGMGVVNRRRGNAEQALSHLTQALAAFRQAGDALEQARVLLSIGRTRHARGEYQQAISAHAEALNIYEALHDRWRTILALNDIGECYQALYDMDNALRYHERALSLAEQYVEGANIIKPDIQRNFGVNLIELGRTEEGIAYLEEALGAAREMGNREQEALILYHLTRAYLRQGDQGGAGKYVSDLSNVADLLDADRFRALAAFVRGELLFAQGNRLAAIAELHVAMLDAQTSVDRGMLWKLHATMSHVVDDPAIASVHMHIAADFIQQTAEPLQDPRLKASFINAAPVTAVLVAAGIDPEKLLRE